jgi:hypothetical protein
MDLVDEQYIVGFKIGEQRGQVAGAFQHRARSLAQVHAHFPGNDMRQRGFPQPRRTEQQYVVERLGSAACGMDEDFQLPARLFLADIFFQVFRA